MMLDTFLLPGILMGISAGAIRYGRALDEFINGLYSLVRERLSRHSRENQALQSECDWLQQILVSLRTGQSLESALEHYALSNPPETMLQRTRALLEGNAEDDPASRLLLESLRSGSPCATTLQFLRTMRISELRGRRKLRALTFGARLQAIVLSVIPWILLASFFLSDPDLGRSLFENPICWVIWLIALFLCSTGFLWMRRILQKKLRPQTLTEREKEELLPQFLLDLVAFVGSGRDIADSVNLSIQKMPNQSSLKNALAGFQGAVEASSPWKALCLLLCKALEQGAPLREEIFLLLQELQSQKEARWEELAQKLPLQLLAPLFSCFFLACLLVCFSLLIPFLETF